MTSPIADRASPRRSTVGREPEQGRLFDDAEPRRGLRWWAWLLIVVAIAAVGYGGYRFFTRSDADSAKAGAGRNMGPVPVVTGIARTGDMPLYLTGLGTVTPLNTVTVRTRVDGQIDILKFVEGQAVTQGDLLAQIDPRPFEVQLAQAQGQLAKDQAALKNGQVDLERYRKAEDAISQQQLATQAAAVDQYAGAVAVDQALIDSAKLQLSYSRITAPLSGRIGLKMVDAGNMVHASDANGIAVISQFQPITVVFSLPQDDIPKLLQSMSAGTALPVDAYDRDLQNKLASGSLLAVDNQVDPTTGTVRLKAQFANDAGALFPNQFVNARLLVDVLQQVVIVPAAAVQRGPESAFVYVVKADKTVDLRDIVVGPTEAGEVVIEKGLAPGEVVVVDGVDKLQKGKEVAPRPAGAGRHEGAGSAGGTTRPGSTQPSTRHALSTTSSAEVVAPPATHTHRVDVPTSNPTVPPDAAPAIDAARPAFAAPPAPMDRPATSPTTAPATGEGTRGAR